METEHCLLCSRAIKNGIKINEINKTTHSKIDLLMFLMILFDETKENLQNNNVCVCCFETINELDFAKERSKELTHVLLNFWKTKQNETQLVIVKQELIDEVSDEDSHEKQFVDNLIKDDVPMNISLFDNNKVQIKVENQDDEVNSTIEDVHSIKEEIEVEEQIVQQEVVDYVHTSKKRQRKQTQRLYSCELCDKKFKANKNLKIHMGVHTEFNAYFCDICNKSFNNKVYLDRHKIVHSDKFPYSCNICNRKFKHHSSLTKHKLSHTENRDFGCSICNNNFKSSIHLKNHMNDVHLGEYQHQCKYCQRKFKRPSHLQKHYQTHVKNGLLHYCSICGSGFESEEKLKSHILITHKDKCESKENIDIPAKNNSNCPQENELVQIKNENMDNK